MAIDIRHIDNSTDEINDAYAVREKVFQKEQGISASDDLDGKDGEAEQFVAYDDQGDAIGTCRYRVLEDNTGKVERVAVLPEYRGQHIGKKIMESIEQNAREQGLGSLLLDAQMSSASFYEDLGYHTVGKPFDEVGIPHVKMALNLDGDQ